MRAAMLGVLTVVLGVPGVWAQTAPAVENVTVAPIECWTRTSARSVRVGEMFTLVLTCAVLETQATTVVPDQSRLDPSVLQIPPFEVVGGTQARDLRTPTQRFFQYEYNVRFLGEMIGADVALPGPSITYRVQSRVQSDAAVESREREYNLPSQTIRVVSLVPALARDIRDVPPETFRQLEARRFRANVLGIVRWILLGLAAVTVLWAFAALVKRPKSAAVAKRVASDGAVLGAVTRALARIGRERQADGWTADRAAETLGALRVTANYAVGRPVAQNLAGPKAERGAGQLAVAAGWRRRRLLVSGSATAEAVAQAVQRAELEGGAASDGLPGLQAALERLDAAVYGRGAALDESALDEALEQGISATRAAGRHHTWLARMLRQIRTSAVGLRERAWAR